MKPALSLLMLLATSSAGRAGPMIAGFELPHNINGGHIIGAGLGIAGILIVTFFLVISSSQKRKAQKVQLAYETQLDAFRQSIRKTGANRAQI
jgi:hypothetical protein